MKPMQPHFPPPIFFAPQPASSALITFFISYKFTHERYWASLVLFDSKKMIFDLFRN